RELRVQHLQLPVLLGLQLPLLLGLRLLGLRLPPRPLRAPVPLIDNGKAAHPPKQGGFLFPRAPSNSPLTDTAPRRHIRATREPVHRLALAACVLACAGCVHSVSTRGGERRSE